MTIIVNDDAKNYGMYSETLFKQEIEMCEPGEDRLASLFATRAVTFFGGANYDDNVFKGNIIASGDHAIRLLDSLPLSAERDVPSSGKGKSFPHTKAVLLEHVLVALECAEEEEKYLKFASALMSPRNKKTDEEKKAVMDMMRKHLREKNFLRPDSVIVKKFIAVLRQMSHRSENPVFREMLHFVARTGKAEDFKELINFAK